LEKVCRLLDAEPGETTNDGTFSIETVNCLGACALGPMLVVEGQYFGQMTPAKVGQVLMQYTEPSEQQESR
jgi:NADH-quinone oxidoreductase subunit E